MKACSSTLPIYEVKATPVQPDVHDEGSIFAVFVRARDVKHAERIIARYMPQLRILSVKPDYL